MLVKYPPTTPYYWGKTSENYLWSHLPAFCCSVAWPDRHFRCSPLKRSQVRLQHPATGNTGVTVRSAKVRRTFTFRPSPSAAPWWPLVTRSLLAARRVHGRRRRVKNTRDGRFPEFREGTDWAGGYFKFNVPCFCHHPHNPRPTGRV